MSDLHNSLTRLSSNDFELKILPYFRNITVLLNDFLEHRSLDAIIYNAEKAFISKNRSKNCDILLEQLQYFRRDMNVFLEQIKKMRQILIHVDIIKKNHGQAVFLERMSEHPICKKILEDMGSNSMMIGGRMNIWKRLTRQETWRYGKLNTFFFNLTNYIKVKFASFHIPRHSEIFLYGQVQELFVEAYTNPDFGKMEKSAVDKVVEEIYAELAADFLKNMPSAGKTTINRSA
jgi:hypothetical protein